jgi:hypothetical protein
MRALLPIFFAIATACHGAGVLTVTFVPNLQSGSPGDLVQFFGTLTNNTIDEVFINGDSILFPLGVDDSPFFINAPASLAGGGSTGLIELLEVTIPPAQPSGTLDGVLTVVGGANDTATDNLGSGDFHLSVGSAGAVPDPGSLLLMASGLACLVWRRRRKR